MSDIFNTVTNKIPFNKMNQCALLPENEQMIDMRALELALTENIFWPMSFCIW